MKKVSFITLFGVIVLIVGISGYLFGQTQSIEQRIENQQKRIDQALQAKELTADDAKMLQGNLSKINEEWTRLKSEKKLTQEARDKLNASLDQNSEMINQKRQATTKAPPASPAKPAPAQQAGTTTSPAPKAPAEPAKAITPNPPDPKIQQEIANQQKRIDEGVKNKQLTLDESKTVQANLDAIKNEDSTLRAQGQLTNEQKDRLLSALDQNNKMVTDKKNNQVKDMTQHISLTQRAHTLQERYARQLARINEGIKSKELSPEEAKKLQENVNFVKNQDARLRAAGGGELTNAQKKELHKLLDQNSDMIYDKKHNPVKAIK
jgi:chromosome segregation ATPase